MYRPESALPSDWFFKLETDWMIYLPCVVRGQLDPVFSFKDEQKREQKHVHTEMQFQWAMRNITYSIVMRTINTTYNTCTCRCTRKLYKSINITKLLTEL